MKPYTSYPRLQAPKSQSLTVSVSDAQMYLHLMDPTRDIALMNKSDDIVPDKFGVPPCWWPSKMKPEKGSDGEVKWVKSE